MIHSWDRRLSGAALRISRLILLIPLLVTLIMIGPILVMISIAGLKMVFSISTLLLV